MTVDSRYTFYYLSESVISWSLRTQCERVCFVYLLQLVFWGSDVGDLHARRFSVSRNTRRGAFQAVKRGSSHGQTCKLHQWIVRSFLICLSLTSCPIIQIQIFSQQIFKNDELLLQRKIMMNNTSMSNMKGRSLLYHTLYWMVVSRSDLDVMIWFWITRSWSI